MVGLKRVVAIYSGLNHYKDKRGCDGMTTSNQCPALTPLRLEFLWFFNLASVMECKQRCPSQQRFLATYLFPGRLGRRVRFGLGKLVPLVPALCISYYLTTLPTYICLVLI